MIVACIGVYGERIDQAIVGIKRLVSSVDRYVVIVDETVTEKQIEQLKTAGCEVYFHPWEDSMVKMRNQYLQKIQTDDWVIVHDPDEWFNEQFCKDIRKILAEAEKKQIDLLLINSHDILVKEDGNKTDHTSDFFKNLIFRKRTGTFYEGTGEVKEVHEVLQIPGLQKTARLEKDKYWYEHVKYWHEVWERAARNVFMAGGGNNVGERNAAWKPLRTICDDLGLDSWTKAREYFRKGKIDNRLKKWLWDNRFEGFDWQHEMMEFGRWYFEFLHPEEKEIKIEGKTESWEPVKELRKGSPAEIMRFIEDAYMKILGRHADQEGKEAYTKAILDGQIQREQLAQILMQSPEYQQKVGGLEQIKITLPIDVNIKLSEKLIIEALIQSKLWWGKFKPKFDIGTFLEIMLGDRWPQFIDFFYAEEPDFNQFLKKLRGLAKSA